MTEPISAVAAMSTSTGGTDWTGVVNPKYTGVFGTACDVYKGFERHHKNQNTGTHSSTNLRDTIHKEYSVVISRGNQECVRCLSKEARDADVERAGQGAVTVRQVLSGRQG